MSTYGRPDWALASGIAGALPHALAVGSIDIDAAAGIRPGCCIRIHERWILTAHHVIDVPDFARRATASFNRLAPDAPAFAYRLDPDAGFFPSEDGIYGPSGKDFHLDYVFIALKGPFPPDDPSAQHVARLRVATPAAGTPARIAQPREGLLQFPVERMAGAGYVEGAVAPFLYYKTSTRPGTSGAAVFDPGWGVVAVHTSNRMNREPSAELRRVCNSGTLVGAILEDVSARYPGFPDIVTLAD